MMLAERAKTFLKEARQIAVAGTSHESLEREGRRYRVMLKQKVRAKQIWLRPAEDLLMDLALRSMNLKRRHRVACGKYNCGFEISKGSWDEWDDRHSMAETGII